MSFIHLLLGTGLSLFAVELIAEGVIRQKGIAVSAGIGYAIMSMVYWVFVSMGALW